MSLRGKGGGGDVGGGVEGGGGGKVELRVERWLGCSGFTDIGFLWSMTWNKDEA